MNHSEWNLLDLHIHSKFSDKVKKNDYSGNGYTAVQLLDKLNHFVRDNEKHKMIFSITDHNCVDIKLYEELSKEIKNDKYRNLNYIIGVELDIKDSSIYSDIFHCLLYFDTYELDKIESVMKSIFDSCNSIEERGNEDNYPNIAKIFRKIMENGIKKMIFQTVGNHLSVTFSGILEIFSSTRSFLICGKGMGYNSIIPIL